MLRIIKMRIKQGNQTIKNIRTPVLTKKFRGLPLIQGEKCRPNCRLCEKQCPTGAITGSTVELDMGKCIFCGDCARICPENIIQFTNNYRTACSRQDQLLITRQNKSIEQYSSNTIKKYFGRSLKLRQVSAGGCNACEMELNACSNVNFDMSRFGIEFTASPRHADGIVITGPVTENMADALRDTYNCTPDPKLVILCGTCAISKGIFADSDTLDRSFLNQRKIDLYIPGCPPHPLTVINGILNLLGR